MPMANDKKVPATVQTNSTPTMGAGRTLEDLVKEMRRPMFKEGLDRHGAVHSIASLTRAIEGAVP